MDTNNLTSEVAPLKVPNIRHLIEQFLALRDRKKAIEALHKQQMASFKSVMDELAAKLLAHMRSTNVDNLSTEGGSAYQSLQRRASLSDIEAFRTFVIENEAFDLVDWRANVTHVFEYISENKGLSPPGVNASSFMSIGVRRPNEKAED